MTLAGSALAVGGAQAPRLPATFAFTGINVVDVRTGKIIPNRTVLVAGKTIVAVQDAAVPLDVDVTPIAGTGKYVMPGLWDMHVHVAHEDYLNQFVANGVTGVRDMGGGQASTADGCESLGPDILRRWRSEIAAGQRVGPEMVISGPPLSGTGWPTSLPARTPAEVKAAVSALKRQRVDFLKVYEQIPLPAYEALATAAKRSGLWFAGHVPEAVGPLTAIRAGQRSIEHIRDALLMCFTDDTAELDRFFAEDKWGVEDRNWGRAANAACPAIIAALQISDVWLTPTLTVEQAKVGVEDPAHVADPRRRTLPHSVRAGYAAYVKGKLAQSAADRASERLWWRKQQKLVGRIGKAGVRLLAGTDTACQGGLPGYSLHGELERLVAAGLSPAHALRTATVEPARYLGRINEGTVAAGFRANLLILDANPLEQITNTRRIHSVVLNGKLVRQAAR